MPRIQKNPRPFCKKKTRNCPLSFPCLFSTQIKLMQHFAPLNRIIDEPSPVFLVSGSSNRAMSQYYSTSLTSCDLILLKACLSGASAGAYGNLVNQARASGARCVIGWTEITDFYDSQNWMNIFFSTLSTGVNVGVAMNAANNWASTSVRFPITATATYSGTSPLNSLILG